MNINEPNIEGDYTYQSFLFDINRNMRIMLVYKNDTKELNYINIYNDACKPYRTLGKYYDNFELAFKSYKSVGVLNALKEVEQYYLKNINTSKIEKKAVPNILLNKVYHC